MMSGCTGVSSRHFGTRNVYYLQCSNTLPLQQNREIDVRRQSNAAYGRYVTVEQRKASFVGRWPHAAYLQNIENMVKYGFFYTGEYFDSHSHR